MDYCKAIDRVIAALNYYHILFITPLSEKYGKDPEALFEAFVDDLYPRRKMLNDYIHWALYHKDSESLLEMRKQLQIMCDRASQCRATRRHYRDRRSDGNGTDAMESKWFHEIMDSIHFTVYHLHELGLRMSVETKLALKDEEKDKFQFVQEGLKRMAKDVESKRDNFRTERLDGVGSSKYTLQVDTGDVNKRGSQPHKSHGL